MGCVRRQFDSALPDSIMKIAILSDIHDNIWNLKKVINKINGKVEALIFCGDLVAPSTASLLAKADVPTYAVLGNNDEDHIGIQKMGGEKMTWFHLSQEYGELNLGGRKIAFHHYPRLGKLLAESGKYDAVFYGHNHIPKMEMVGKTLLLNPGPVCGFRKHKTTKASLAIYNTKSNSAEIIFINN